MSKYPYIVNKNGVWYPAGTEVPDGDQIKNETMEREKPEHAEYTKTDINRMNVSELRRVAKNVGTDGADDMTGTDLKEYLIDLFKL